ncbi:lytic transglycosylase domain-containing protein [Acetobacteraceae bacterium KSS8]|uniref:Lytic transglycosylase domain-containing protein n=1 Tax=Endosaccharibacter trunci TaxID=2812733 RepID=A0ABT1WAT1_9PROT|nr:lytic transglycosylase domain-containing protein [Acetobacteraceae bacterium KSS8]
MARWRQSGDRARFRIALLVLATMSTVSLPRVAVHAQTAPLDLHAPSDPYAGQIAEAAQRFGIPTAWIRAIMRVESRGDRHAVSPKGALGLMQIMPATWAELRTRYGLGRDPFDPRDNILAGAAFLREMHDRYGSPGFLAAYNAGPGRYEDYRDRRRPLPAETVAYVAALVPFVGDGAIDGPVLVAASDPSSWTQAPLFITRSAGTEPAGRATSKQQPNDTPAIVAVRDLSAIAPQSGELFVPVSASGPQR